MTQTRDSQLPLYRFEPQLRLHAPRRRIRMDWRHDAACLTEDPELFFPIGNTGPALVQIEEAKAVCRRCRSEEHTSELQSRGHLVCRLMLEKKKMSSQL